MKDPASDFLLKHQPPEYYKCHLHAVLEKGVGEGGGGGRDVARCHLGEEAETFGWREMSLSLCCVKGRAMRSVEIGSTL